EREHESLVVVGVLADEVRAARRGPHALGRGSRELLEKFGRVRHAMASRSRSAPTSGGISAAQAPMAASDPARNLSLSAPRRGDVSCRCMRTVSRPTLTGA